MATANQASEITISGKAMDLLECFVSGLDEKILELAEIYAKRRHRGAGPVEIEAKDVEQAAEMFFGVITEKLGSDPEKAEALNIMKGMLQCLKDKCRIPAQDKPR